MKSLNNTGIAHNALGGGQAGLSSRVEGVGHAIAGVAHRETTAQSSVTARDPITPKHDLKVEKTSSTGAYRASKTTPLLPAKGLRTATRPEFAATKWSR